jgi:hypothetical protein
MMKLSLNEDERGQLEERIRCTPNRRLRNRCQAILMAARGRQHRQIAKDLGISVRTLQRWLHAYQTSGLEGLTIQWVAGRVPVFQRCGLRLSWRESRRDPSGVSVDRLCGFDRFIVQSDRRD